jgi:hypothetical protein
MVSFTPRIGRAILSLGVVAFLSVGTFGMFSSATMGMDGTMSHCPFMPGMNVCPMTAFEHISFMQGLFSNVPHQQDTALALILAMSFVAIASLIWFRQLFVSTGLSRSIGYFYRNRYFSFQRVLQELFSSGILNSKRY